MNLYLDEDSIDPLLVTYLRKAGHAATVSTEVGGGGASDPKQLEFAIHNDLALLTRNYSDFLDLHDLVLASGGSHPGILVVHAENDRPRDLTPRAIAAASSKLAASGMPLADQIHSVNDWR
jgi:predicted nuclease of predicted toxin-antitoxin system